MAVAGETAVVTSPAFERHPASLGWAVAIDLGIVLPARRRSRGEGLGACPAHRPRRLRRHPHRLKKGVPFTRVGVRRWAEAIALQPDERDRFPPAAGHPLA